jgi:hypothetical protein
MKTDIDMLGQIQKVDAPPFLLTRIKQKIENTHNSNFSPRLAWSLAMAVVLVLLLNLGVIISKTSHTDSLADTMNLLPKNTLYR